LFGGLSSLLFLAAISIPDGFWLEKVCNHRYDIISASPRLEANRDIEEVVEADRAVMARIAF